MGQFNKRDSSFNDCTKANQTRKSRKVKPKHVNLQETNKSFTIFRVKNKKKKVNQLTKL